ncbi:MAG: archaetidylserine decarboxylase [Haliangiales bacterium]
MLPRRLRSSIYRAFAQRVGANLDEVELPLDAYDSLAAFFARRLRPGSRPLDAAGESIVAPCDGVIAALGEATDGSMLQAKGKHYALRQLLGDDQLAAHLEGGSYLTIYLSPADYHRVHSPLAGTLTGYTHIPGTLFPVNPLFSRSVEGLMAINERVVFHLDTTIGIVAVVMVAAVGVSNIELSHKRRETRLLAERGRRGAPRRIDHEHAVTVERGEELGAFHLGSTTIMIFPPQRVALSQSLRVGDPVLFGQKVGQPTLRSRRSS